MDGDADFHGGCDLPRLPFAAITFPGHRGGIQSGSRDAASASETQFPAAGSPVRQIALLQPTANI